jgi:hypothetical protein
MFYRLNRDGKPERVESAVEAEIGLSLILTDAGAVRVSTVFLGLDHNIFGDQPLLFETMVFRGSEGFEQRRYSDIHAAIEGHQQFVARHLVAKECKTTMHPIARGAVAN